MKNFDHMTREEQLREETICMMMESGLSEEEAISILDQRQGELF